MAKKPIVSKRRAREEKDTALDTMFNSLSVEQLRTVYFQLNGKLPKKCQSHADHVEAISGSGRSDKDTLEACYLAEAENPPKHFFVSKCVGSLPQNIKPKKLISENLNILKGLKLSFSAQREDYLHITLDQPIRVTEYVQVDAETRKKRTSTLRHPIFVRYFFASNLVYFCYPGFTQGLATKKDDRINYEAVIREVQTALGREFGWTFEAQPFRNSIDLLLEMSSKRISRIKATPKKGDGRLTVTTSTGTVSTEKWMANFLTAKADPKKTKELEKAISDAFKASAMDSMVLYWAAEGLCTRVEFWGVGAEFLFIWRKAEHSYSLCQKIFELLLSVSVKQGSDNFSSVLTEIKKLSSGDHIYPVDLINRIGGTPEDIRDSLIFATKSGLVAPVYRLKTDLFLQEEENKWTTDLARFSKIFTDDQGNLFDGTNPSNIEIAFARTTQEDMEVAP